VECAAVEATAQARLGTLAQITELEVADLVGKCWA